MFLVACNVGSLCHMALIMLLLKQGWWWEKEEGLLAPQAGAGWAFTHACCACNVLRNLAMESSNHAALVGKWPPVQPCMQLYVSMYPYACMYLHERMNLYTYMCLYPNMYLCPCMQLYDSGLDSLLTLVPFILPYSLSMPAMSSCGSVWT